MSLRKELLATTTVVALTALFNDKCIPHASARPKTQRRWKRAFDARKAELEVAPAPVKAVRVRKTPARVTKTKARKVAVVV